MDYNSTGTGNTAVGNQALYFNTTGNNNTALGFMALITNTTGHSNVALGIAALGVMVYEPTASLVVPGNWGVPVIVRVTVPMVSLFESVVLVNAVLPTRVINVP